MKKFLPLIAAIATLAAAFAPQPAQARVIKIYSHNGPSRKPVAVTGVALSVADTTLSVGKTLTLKENVLPANATNKAVRWTSSDTAVATVENGLVTTLDTGVTTITVTTDDGGKTATCKVRVCFLIVEGSCICFAEANVDDSATFAAYPDSYGKFYQWNRSKAWAATGQGNLADFSETVDNVPSWSFNPCPDGWRLPTPAEFDALVKAGSTWANANAGRGNAVAGRFYGGRASTCSLPDKMAGCIFMPAAGICSSAGCGIGEDDVPLRLVGEYWSNSRHGTGIHASGIYLSFNEDLINWTGYDFFGTTWHARSLRCARTVP